MLGTVTTVHLPGTTDVRIEGHLGAPWGQGQNSAQVLSNPTGKNCF